MTEYACDWHLAVSGLGALIWALVTVIALSFVLFAIAVFKELENRRLRARKAGEEQPNASGDHTTH